MYSLIVTAKMKDVDPQAWLADILAASPRTQSAGSAAPAVELAAGSYASSTGGVTMAAVAAVFTIGYVAKILGEDGD
jgi:hypothetical protein